MKSFGVRLGAGAVTIALAAYVAVIAQKQPRAAVSDWTAESTGENIPADPLVDDLDSGWLQQPETSFNPDLSENSAAVGESTSSDPSVASRRRVVPSEDGSVQLVQHASDTQDVSAGSESSVSPAFATDLPSSLSLDGAGENGLVMNEETVTRSQGVAPDSAWLLPNDSGLPNGSGLPVDQGEGIAVNEESTNASLSSSGLGFPSVSSVKPNESSDAPSAGQILAVPTLVDSNQDFSTPADASPSSGISLSAPGAVLGEEKLNEPALSDGGGIAFNAGNEVVGTVDDLPSNQLRGNFDGVNELRESELPADLGFSISGEEVDVESGLSPVNQIGSGVVSAASEIADLSTGSSSAMPVPTIGIPSLQEQPVGNGLREVTGLSGEGLASDSLRPDGFSGSGNEKNQSGLLNGDAGVTLNPNVSPSVVASDEAAGVRGAISEGPMANEEAGTVSGLALAPSGAMTAPQAIPLDSVNGRPLNPGSQVDGALTVESPAVINALATLDSPGERRLEGAQTPSVVIHKLAPAEVRVGKPASFIVNVQNVGSAEALNVEVHDRIPAGMRFIEATPAASQVGDQLMWELGKMSAGEERTITLQLVAEEEGELGSVARVSFEAAASVRTLSTKPELKIVQRVPERGVLIGQQLEIEIEVSNPGSGSAIGVILQEDVPPGLEHPRGRQLDNALGTLDPGEVRRQVLRLRAVAPGIVENTIRLVSDDGLETEHTVAVQVISPDLQVELTGPSRRFLERSATYQLQIANQGTADATNVEIAVHLDRGFTFVSTENEGRYDPNRHAVFWSLAQLPVGAQGSVPLTLLPVETGQQAIRIEANADLGVVVQAERTMSVEGFAELTFGIRNPGGPIEIGAETEYEVFVTNSGSMSDRDVRIELQLPQDLELVSTSGDAGTDGSGLVAFQPITELRPGETLKQSVRVRGLQAGVHVVRAVVVSEHGSVPVTKEESTRVYADR